MKSGISPGSVSLAAEVLSLGGPLKLAAAEANCWNSEARELTSRISVIFEGSPPEAPTAPNSNCLLI